jgi:hypothetical protein
MEVGIISLLLWIFILAQYRLSERREITADSRILSRTKKNMEV